MIEHRFRRMTSEWWRGRIVLAARELRSAQMIVKEGTYLLVTRKYKGLEVESVDACRCCGVKIRLTRVTFDSLHLIGPAQDYVR